MRFSDEQSSSDCSTVMTSNRSPGTHREPFGTPARSQDDTCAEALSSLAYYWRIYQSFVIKHRMKLQLADGAIHRLLFWLPHHDHSGDGSSPPWREVLYGLLSVNQLAMHCSQQQRIENTYGFSIRTRDDPAIPATLLRIALNVIHCLMPSLLELVVPTNSQNMARNTAKNKTRRQAQLRLRLEQLKCTIRLYLLYSYWTQLTRQQLTNSSTNSSASSSDHTLPGIMLDGGMYQPMEEPLGLSLEELQSGQRKRHYRGRRTGLRISKDVSSSNFESPQLANSPSQSSARRRILLADLLYTLRPVCWAAAEARYAVSQQPDDPSSPFSFRFRSDPLLKSWIVTLGMELLSLGLFSEERRRGNPYSIEEWNRRRIKLFLYLLRAPVWNRFTSPALERASAMVRQVPLVGGLFDSYIWDWILYWKHPYVSEES